MGKVKLAVLTTIAIMLINMGVDFFKKGDLVYGAVCTVVGAIVLLSGIYLYEKGLIERMGGRVGCGERQ